MNLPNELFQAALQAAKPADDLKDAAKKTLSLIDLTSLNLDDTDEAIIHLCDQAVTPYGHVAAVCVYPKFISLAKSKLDNTGIHFATVVNFPSGKEDDEKVIAETKKSIEDGADEIDLVWDYESYLAGDVEKAVSLVRKIKDICSGKACLKVIFETGKFPSAEKIYQASLLVIDAGADFLKTSTGKVEVNATLEAAAAMLLAIKERGKPVGFKAAGGVRNTSQASEYLALAAHIMGADWATPDTFRFGASSLLGEVLSNLGE